MLLALTIALAMAWRPSAEAVEIPALSCCCEAKVACEEPAARSTCCACPSCPVQIPAQPLLSKQESLDLPPILSTSGRWSHFDESAAERSVSPPVPPPRAVA
jgi:hypothetical protein